jgi:hypothetical protein
VPQGRPAIPRAIERAVLVEAGHRCAIPTCKQTPVELAHITPWASSSDHSLETSSRCVLRSHRRYDSGEIDRPALLQYKANLGVIGGRYGDLERRVLEVFVDQPATPVVLLPGALQVLMWYLVRDGIVDQAQVFTGGVASYNGLFEYRLAPKGRQLVENLRRAEAIE